MKSLINSYACTFSAINQDVICTTIPSIKYDKWVGELSEKNIYLTDVDDSNSSIDILIGADVAGKLMTGRKYNVTNGLTAFETQLGWTVMGKFPKESRK